MPSYLIVDRRIISRPDNLGYLHDPGDGDFDVNSSHLTNKSPTS